MCGRHGDSSLVFGEYQCLGLGRLTYFRTNSIATTTVSRLAINCALYRYREGEGVFDGSRHCCCLVVPDLFKLGVLKFVKVSWGLPNDEGVMMSW